MKLLTLTLFLFIGINYTTYSQKGKCKYKINAVDPINGKRQIKTNGVTISSTMHSESGMYIQIDGDDIYLYIYHVFKSNGSGYFTIEKDAVGILLLENGEKLTINAKEYKKCAEATPLNLKMSKGMYAFSVDGAWRISKQQLSAIKQSSVKMIRMSLIWPNETIKDMDIHITKKTAMQNEINCLEQIYTLDI